MAIIKFVGLGTVFKALGAAPKLYEKYEEWQGKPTAKDRDLIVEYCRRLDERRVFSEAHQSEVVEACLASLDEVRAFTDEVLARARHPVAQAAMGAVLDEVRKFLDKWIPRRSPRLNHRLREFPGREPSHEFFQDLGELRVKMRIYVGMLTDLVPKATAPRLARS